ncbi:MAG: outer membrane protein assembly factor BamA [Marinoscillum sp.]
MNHFILKISKLLFLLFALSAITSSSSFLVAQSLLQKNQLIDSSGTYSIHNIYILGNEKTKNYIITRELNVKEGDEVAKVELLGKLEWSRNNVYNTNLFSTVSVEPLYLDSATIDIMVKVEERWYVYPSPVFRLADRNFNDWWYNRDRDISRVKYGIKLDVYNFRGRKEKLKFIGLTGFEQRLIFEYTIPYIDKSQKHGLTFGGGHLTNKRMSYKTVDHLTIFTDSTAGEIVNRKTTSGYVMYTHRPSFYDYHHVLLQGFNMSISDSIAIFNPNYFGNGATTQQALGLSYTHIRDLRNNKNYPLTGYLSFSTLEKMGLGIFKDLDIWRLTSNYYQFFDLGKNLFASISFGGQLTTTNNVPYFNYTQFGLENYFVRGYELDVIEGPQNFLTKNSLKWRFWQTSANLGKSMPLTKFKKIPFAFYGKIIGDAGWVNNYPNYPQGQQLTNKLLYGVGLGLDVVTLYDLTFRFEYTYNAEGELNFFINFQTEL